MKKQYKKKDPFDDLDPLFKDAVVAASPEEIRDRIATIALDQAELMAAQKEDEDLKECKERVKEASAIYRDGTKFNKLKIAFAKRVLEDKGKL